MKKNRWPRHRVLSALVLGVALTAAASAGGYSPYNGWSQAGCAGNWMGSFPSHKSACLMGSVSSRKTTNNAPCRSCGGSGG